MIRQLLRVPDLLLDALLAQPRFGGLHQPPADACAVEVPSDPHDIDFRRVGVVLFEAQESAHGVQRPARKVGRPSILAA